MKKLVIFAFVVVLFLLPFTHAHELEYLTWGGNEVDSGVAYLPGEAYSILVGSTKSFEDVRAGFIVKVDDTVRITGVSPPEAIQSHHQAVHQTENEF
jgi:hypothetical protein